VPMPWVLSPNYKPTNPWNGKVMVVSKWRWEKWLSCHSVPRFDSNIVFDQDLQNIFFPQKCVFFRPAIL
jgi:hypothetical protein